MRLLCFGCRSSFILYCVLCSPLIMGQCQQKVNSEQWATKHNIISSPYRTKLSFISFWRSQSCKPNACDNNDDSNNEWWAKTSRNKFDFGLRPSFFWHARKQQIRLFPVLSIRRGMDICQLYNNPWYIGWISYVMGGLCMGMCLKIHQSQWIMKYDYFHGIFTFHCRVV